MILHTSEICKVKVKFDKQYNDSISIRKHVFFKPCIWAQYRVLLKGKNWIFGIIHCMYIHIVI